MARAATPRQPLVVLSEAGFPEHVSSPWRAHRRGARSDDSGFASAPPHSASPFGDDAGDVVEVGVPVAILRAPVTREDAGTHTRVMPLQMHVYTCVCVCACVCV